jgi:hypothetical protein
MIGFIAGPGIVVRNSIILVDFIELRLREGLPLEQALVDAGAGRFRPVHGPWPCPSSTTWRIATRVPNRCSLQRPWCPGFPRRARVGVAVIPFQLPPHCTHIETGSASCRGWRVERRVGSR